MTEEEKIIFHVKAGLEGGLEKRQMILKMKNENIGITEFKYSMALMKAIKEVIDNARRRNNGLSS